MSEWKPIITAPRDGTYVLVACSWAEEDENTSGDWLRVVRWDPRNGYDKFPWAVMDPEGVAYGGSIRHDIPTHWMPLPQKPALS